MVKVLSVELPNKVGEHLRITTADGRRYQFVNKAGPTTLDTMRDWGPRLLRDGIREGSLNQAPSPLGTRAWKEVQP